MGIFDSEKQPTAEKVDANQSALKLLDLRVLAKDIAQLTDAIRKSQT